MTTKSVAPAVLVAGQVLGVVAVLVGAGLLLPLGWALLACGALVALLCTVLEALALSPPVARPDRRSRPSVKAAG